MAETLADLAAYQSDHDLLIGLTRDVKHLGEDIKDLNTAVTLKNEDHERRIRDLERGIESQLASSKTWRLILGIGIPLLAMALAWLYLSFFTLESTLDKRIATAITTNLENYGLIKN